MSSWRSLIQLLRELYQELDPAWTKAIETRFRDEYLRRFEDDLKKYVVEVLENYPDTGQELANFMGYSSRSSADAWRKGSIVLEKFDFFLGTLGAEYPFRSPLERRRAALADTVSFVRRELMHDTFTEDLDEEMLECLQQALAESKRLAELEDAGETEAWCETILKKVRSIVPTRRIEQFEQLDELLAQWGRAYVRTKSALERFVRIP